VELPSIKSVANRRFTQLSGSAKPAENAKTAAPYAQGKRSRAKCVMYNAIANTQPTQRRILNHGNTGRKPMDHHRAAQYSASQMMRGEAIRADISSIARTLDPPVFKTEASFSAFSMGIVYAQPMQTDCILTKSAISPTTNIYIGDSVFCQACWALHATGWGTGGW
jgi:hypothetical protein